MCVFACDYFNQSCLLLKDGILSKKTHIKKIINLSKPDEKNEKRNIAGQSEMLFKLSVSVYYPEPVSLV